MEGIRCPKCGATNDYNHNSCWKCGYQLKKVKRQIELKPWENSFETYKSIPKIIAYIPAVLCAVISVLLIIGGLDDDNTTLIIEGFLIGAAGIGLYFFTKFIVSLIIAPIVLQTEYQKDIRDEILNKKD